MCYAWGSGQVHLTHLTVAQPSGLGLGFRYLPLTSKSPFLLVDSAMAQKEIKASSEQASSGYPMYPKSTECHGLSPPVSLSAYLPNLPNEDLSVGFSFT